MGMAVAKGYIGYPNGGTGGVKATGSYKTNGGTFFAVSLTPASTNGSETIYLMTVKLDGIVSANLCHRWF